ncbi:PEP-CTERM/exosortase system-associated acyltransferase [Pelomonas cellulosilytica]|uniref:PEP-CTERM/exosortase system-associated acyltransferase n=1 Tax=Pelomonas cellulosilytica TaxID=2906762 RepID=A0ABS8Y077_9BURK|nr:PEP-CTERM/exosortase system-associated acyltransferase [Pelomonas sp. P8]MCE4557542.1 PEP-CTERM/exosortase system-associated acyltransferase [Pelomonas sp. P8]
MFANEENVESIDFAPYFNSVHVLPQESPDKLREIENFRFQIYCRECCFLPESDYPDGLERDAYDESSSHFCASNLRGELVGYVRLVKASATAGFPFFDHCQDLLPGISLPPASESAEISRLMVHSAYRRRRGDTLAGVTILDDSLPSEQERRDKSPQILLSMYRQMYLYSVATGIRYWYAAMEKFLARSLGMFGFDFKQVGPEVDYYGPVATYLADLRALEAAVSQSNPMLLAWLKQPSGGVQIRSEGVPERFQAKF